MRVALHTLGCKLNQAETSIIGEAFRTAGFETVSLSSPADVVVINTCTVTNTADKECRQVIRRALRNSPDAFVIVTGCYAQTRPEEVASITGVDLVLGTAEKPRIVELADGFDKGESPRIEVCDTSEAVFGSAASTWSNRADGRVRAFLKVQDGCDYGCSYCIIPEARGPSRSQPVDECADQAKTLLDCGFREIVLTGINLGEYGRGEGWRLVDLVHKLLEEPRLERLKLSSIEPNLLSDELIELAARGDGLMPHFHIPLQSGCDDILAVMRRRYRREVYRQRIERLIAKIPNVCVGADVIVGFPGETDDHFEQTVAFIETLPLAYLHVFNFSVRRGTPASSLPNSVTRRTRQERTRRLRDLSARKLEQFAAAQAGTVRPVLLEREMSDGSLTGLTDNYLRIELNAPRTLLGEIVPVRIGRWTGDRAIGELA